MPRRGTYTMDQQFPLKPLELHHDLATWYARSEEALLRHYSDLGHMDNLRTLIGLDPLPRVPRQAAPGRAQPGQVQLVQNLPSAQGAPAPLPPPPAPVQGAAGGLGPSLVQPKNVYKPVP